MKTRTLSLTMTALFCALTAVLAPLTVTLPVTLVPFSLSLIPVFLTGAVLPRQNALLAQVCYLLLGLAGLPVFSGFSSGAGVLLGPTGGFLLAYPASAFLMAWILEKRFSVPRLALALAAGLLTCYLMGSLWYCAVGHVGYLQALAAAVLPFVLWDAPKALCAGLAAAALRKANRMLDASAGRKRGAEGGGR